MAKSLDTTLTLGKAVSPRGPNCNVGKHHASGVQKQCRLTRHGTWKLTMSFPRPGCSCPRGFWGLLDQGPIEVCDLGSQRLIMTSTLRCALNSTLRGDHCPPVVSAPGAPWDLTLTLTLTRTGTLHQNLSLPRTLTLHLSRLVACALTSALEEDLETGVASALAMSLERTLTLAKALSPWGPIPTSDNTTRLGSRSGAGSPGMEPGSSPCRF